MKPVARAGFGRVAFRRFAALHFSLARPPALERLQGRLPEGDVGLEAIVQRLQSFQAATLLESR